MTSILTATNVAIDGRLLPTSLSFERGEMVALVGPNGGGKTSLLRSLAQVDDCEGNVIVDGEDLCTSPPNRRARLVGFMPASREMVWPLSVRDLLKLGNVDHGNRMSAIIDQLELQPIADRRVDHLSTGERTRALIGRILAASPTAMLLDEPFSNLDPYWVKRLCEIVRGELSETNSCALISIHDLALAGRFDRLIVLEKGSVVFNGNPRKFMVSNDFQKVFRVDASDVLRNR